VKKTVKIGIHLRKLSQN